MVISDWLTMIIEFTRLLISRLELTAALLSVKMACLLKKELDIICVNEVFGTDSKVVLDYIANTAKKFKTFVAYRVQQIKEKTDVQQWRYVPTKKNPADDASRGLKIQAVDGFKGLDFCGKKIRSGKNKL